MCTDEPQRRSPGTRRHQRRAQTQGEIAGMAAGFHSILNIKESAGVERALLASVHASKDLQQARYERIARLAESQRANIGNFLAGANEEQRIRLTRVLESAGYKEALGTRNIVLGMARQSDGSDVSALKAESVGVFAQQTVKLDKLKSVEQKINADIVEVADREVANLQKSILTNVLQGVLALIISAVFAFYTVWSILRNVRSALNASRQMRSGDLTGFPRVSSSDETAMVHQSMDKTREHLVSVIGEIQSTSRELDSGAHEIALGNQHLSDRTQQQAARLETIRAKMRNLSGAVNQSRKRQTEGDDIAQQALELTTQCNDMVKQLHASMEEMRGSSKDIMTITSVIDEIAFQTNLLSLNAAVEAARAGEMGKGFAVVAAEVRQLAQRSSSAASEISELIDTSVGKINKGGDLAESTRNALRDVRESVESVATVMQELSQHSQSESGDIDEIRSMVKDIDEVTQRNAKLVEEVAAASETLGQSTSELTRVTDYFKV
ncbi:MAG: methyl-accepting chemotaxis protein [Pseudomonadota bacterium]